MNPTQKVILLSLNELLDEKSFEKITVNDILEKSQISRSTFYRYFHDKYEVMEVYYRHKVDEILLNTKALGYQEVFYQIYCFVYKEKSYFKKMNQYKGYNSFYDFLLDYSIQYYKNMLNDYHMSNNQKWTIVHFVAYGQVGTMLQWIEEDMFMEPDEFASYMFDILPESIKESVK